MFKPNRKFLILIAFAIAFCSLLHLQLKAQGNQVVSAGSSAATVSFPKTTCTYNWTNSNPAIGLAASGSGDIASFTATNTTGSPITATIIATPSGTRNQPLLYIPNYDDNTVSVIDASTNAIITTLSLGSNTHPYNVTVSRDYNRVFVSNQGTNTVSVIYMPTNNGQYATITGFSNPGAIAIGPGNVTGYVANTGSNTVSIIENINYTINGSITVGNAPVGLALTNDGSILYVSNSADNTISVVNTTTHVVLATIPVDPGVSNMVLSPFNTTNEDKLYVVNAASNEITVISTATNTIINRFSVGSAPKGLTVSPDGSRLYVSSPASGIITAFNTSNGSVIQTINLGSTPTGLSISDDGSLLYLTNAGSNNVKVINTNSFAVTQTIAVGTNPYSVGNFYLSRADCAGPITFTVTVNAAAITPTITTAGTPTALTTIYGTPSPSSSFSVSGVNMTAGILVTPPTGFEVSSDGTSFSNTVTVGGAGTIAASTVYIRLKQTTAVGANYSGNIILTSPGAATVNISMPQSTVTGATLNVTVQNINKPYGNTLTSGSTTTGFTISGLQNGETIPSITITYGAGAAAADAPGNYPGSAVPSPALIGTNGFVSSNYIINLINGNIVVLAPTTPFITANSLPSAVNTVYGTASPSSSFTISGANLTGRVTVTAPAGFEVSTDNITFGPTATIPAANVGTNKTIYIRLTTTASAGSHTGTINISSSGAADVQVAIPSSTVTPAGLTIIVRGTKVYGGSFTNFTAGPADVDFSPFNQQLKNGEIINAIDITFTGGNNPTDPAGTYTQTIHIANVQGTNGFLPSNYTITYQSGDLVVNPAPLTINAADVNKPNGATLTGGTVTNGYTVIGLKNGETITGVTVAYGNGSAANAAGGAYPGSVVLSNATGANGFLASNYTITYVPAKIIVGAAGPAITASGNLTPLTTVYGTPSTAETFTVSGTNMTAGILITPPAGFEVSTDDATFSPTVSVGVSGNVTAQTVYIRLKSTANAGTYGGNIVMSSNGASNFSLTMPTGTVTPAPLTITASNNSKTYGQTLSAVTGFTNFTATGLKNSETISSISVTYGNGASASSNVSFYTASVVVSQPVGTGTFLASNYNITYMAGNLTVTPASLTVTADNQTRQYGAPNPTLTFTYSGFVNGEDTTAITAKPTAATSATLASSPGQYPITLSGGAAQNYTFNYVQGTLTVTAIPGLPVSIPNAFTPNGDGVNDIWNIANLNTYSQSHVQIFNRYGTLVFNSVGYATPWDGTAKSTRVPDGVYYYVITLSPGDTPLSGSVAVIR